MKNEFKRIIGLSLLLLPLLTNILYAGDHSSLGPSGSHRPEAPPTTESDKKQLILYAIQSGLLNSIFAKEICSCHFVSDIPVKECEVRSNLPSGSDLAVHLDVDEKNQTVQVSTSWLAKVRYGIYGGPVAVAFFHRHEPELGCRIMQHGG